MIIVLGEGPEGARDWLEVRQVVIVEGGLSQELLGGGDSPWSNFQAAIE